MSGGKRFVALLWLAALALWWLAGGWLSAIGEITFWLMIVSHALEFVVKRPLFARVGGSMGQHFVQTMLFGLFYWRPLEKPQGEAAGS